ncbi:hypothetical protein GCM10027578_08190 [Spirosoma luteolum]
MPTVTIIPYEARYQPAFKALNTAWIEQYFTLEPHDIEQLDHPDVYILPNNGQIFLARLDDAIVGCVAVVNMGETGFELAKMTVSPAVRGQGVGQQLCLAAIDYVRQLGVPTLWLESNRRLAPALALYRRVGFREVASVPTPYARADIRMEITF